MTAKEYQQRSKRRQFTY